MSPPLPAAVSLAFLKASWDQSHADYIDVFTPLVLSTLDTAPEEGFSLSQLQDAIRSSWRIKIPQAALRTILRRAKKKSLALDQQKVYRVNRSTWDARPAKDVQFAMVERYEDISKGLANYARTKYDLEWSESRAEAVLDEYLTEFSQAILAVRGSGDLIALTNASDSPPEGKFILASYIESLHREDHPFFPHIEDIVKGTMIAGALYYPDISNITRGLSRLTAYLDTRLVLRCLGLAGSDEEAASLELIDLCNQLGVKLRVFRHTYDEITGVLDSAATFLAAPRRWRPYGEVIQHYLSVGATPSDVELESSGLVKRLREIGIEVAERPAHEYKLGVDEYSLSGDLQAAIGYKSDRALHHDIDSLTAIHRIRGATPHVLLEDSKAVFLTTNIPLFRVARGFFRGEYEVFYVPVCLLERIFTTILWVKMPMAAPDLPRKRLIADCYSALQPSTSFWLQFLKEVDSLAERGSATEDDAVLARLMPSAQRALMEETFGVGEVDEQTVARVLGQIKSTMKAELLAETIDRAPAGVQIPGEEATLLEEHFESTSDFDRPARPEFEQALEEKARQLDELSSLVAARAQTRANVAGQRVYWFVFVLLVAPVVLALSIAAPAPLPSLAPSLAGAWKVLAAFLGIVWTALSVIGLVNGLSADLIAKNAAERVRESRLERELSGMRLMP